MDYVLYARSRLAAKQRKTAFQAAYRETFHAVIKPLDNRTAAMVAGRAGAFGAARRIEQTVPRKLSQLQI